MPSKSRLILIAVAVGVMSMVTVPSAFATAEYTVGGEVPVATESHYREKVDISFIGEDLVWENCTDKGYIFNGKEEVMVTCVEGSLLAQPSCVVPNIKYNLDGELFYLNSEHTAIGDKLSPESGTTITTVKITGIGCSLAGEYKLTGTIVGEFESVGKEAKSLNIVFPEKALPGAGLKFGGDAATYEGTDTIELKSHELFGVK